MRDITTVLTVPLAVAVVATATKGAWVVAGRRDSGAMMVGGLFTMGLLAGCIVQLVTPRGTVLGLLWGFALSAAAAHRRLGGVVRGASHSVCARSPIEARLILLDRIDEIRQSTPPIQRVITGISVGLLIVTGASLISWGAEPGTRVGLIVGPLVLALPAIWCAGVILQRLERKRLLAVLRSLDGVSTGGNGLSAN